jgi:hypothetical protein
MDNTAVLDDEIASATPNDAFKQLLLRMLDDPEIQQKIGELLRRADLIRSTGINVPQRWLR